MLPCVCVCRLLMCVFLLVCVVLPASLHAKQCPVSDPTVVAKTCADDVTCALFVPDQTVCVGWTYNRCSEKQYRNLRTCECLACPVGAGSDCSPSNECCSAGDCGPATQSTPKPKPMALASTSRLTASYAVCATSLFFLLHFGFF
jgi:hypothetical protein